MARHVGSGEWQGVPRATGGASEVFRLHFGEVGPEADGHVLALLAGVEALADGEGAEVGAPEVLESLLVGGQEVGVEAGAEGGVVGSVTSRVVWRS